MITSVLTRGERRLPWALMRFNPSKLEGISRFCKIYHYVAFVAGVGFLCRVL
jgi:hypothetical protein